ncbi:hypothetical protein FF2_044936 [Malus domestica]
MASQRLLSSLAQSSVHRVPSKSSISTSNPRVTSPSPSSRSASLCGYLLNRTAQYATTAVEPQMVSASPKSKDFRKGKIIDEFTGKGSIRQVCQVIRVVVDVRFEKGLPLIPSQPYTIDSQDQSFSVVISPECHGFWYDAVLVVPAVVFMVYWRFKPRRTHGSAQEDYASGVEALALTFLVSGIVVSAVM